MVTDNGASMRENLSLGEGSGSVVKCLTRDQGAVGLSLTDITALFP